MTDQPILFSTLMIRALLREIEAPGAGKTQTRRMITPRQRNSLFDGTWSDDYILDPGNADWRNRDIPYRVCDRLWCRDEHYQFGHWEIAAGQRTKAGRKKWRFVADSNEVLFDPPAEFRRGRHHLDPGTPAWHKRLGRFMFRRHSRLTLYVSEVRVERLQDISEADAIAEGVFHQNVITDVKCYGGQPVEITADRYWNGTEADEFEGFESAADAYADLWDRLNGQGAWAANPWVSVTTFRPVLGNIDTLPATHQEAA